MLKTVIEHLSAWSKGIGKNNCTILLDLWPICGVAWKATYPDMQPSMRLADEPNPGATWHNYFLPRPFNHVDRELPR
jgi:hypothetical protein